MDQDVDGLGAQQALANLQQGTFGTEGSMLDFPVYDRIKLVSTTLAHTMFQAPVGQGGRTLADTNMVQAGVVPQGQNWRIHAFKISFFLGISMTDAIQLLVMAILNNTTFNFIINNKATQYQWVLNEMLGISFSASPAITQQSGVVGVIKGIVPLNREITLAALTPFRVEINHWVAPDAGIDNAEIRVSLITDMSRAGS